MYSSGDVQVTNTLTASTLVATSGALVNTGQTTGATGYALTSPGSYNYSYYALDFKTSGTSYLTINGSGTVNINLPAGNTFMAFNTNGTSVGSIQVSGFSTAYNTTSDRTLKDNIVDAPSELDTLAKVKVRKFNFKKSPTIVDTGVIADELATVYPQYVTPPTTDTPAQVNYYGMIPHLIKSIQELAATVGTLQTEIELLKKPPKTATSSKRRKLN